MGFLKDLIKRGLYFLWVVNGYLGVRYQIRASRKVTVLITYYNPIRMEHINHQIRNLLRCDFIEKIIISNHNPAVDINSVVKVKSPLLFLINQEKRRGCGYRWEVARQFQPEYMIVADDDILLFPWQVKKLFEALITEPDVPHGLAGMFQPQQPGSFDYAQQTERNVDYLCEIYAVTGKQLQRYGHYKEQILHTPDLERSVEFTADFVIISRTGNRNPKIHNVGYILRCPTFNQAGVAVHKNGEFAEDMFKVSTALDALNPSGQAINTITG